MITIPNRKRELPTAMTQRSDNATGALLILGLAALAISGCAQNEINYSDLSARSVPNIWLEQRIWEVKLSDKECKMAGSLVLELTEEEVESCAIQGARRAHAVSYTHLTLPTKA